MRLIDFNASSYNAASSIYLLKTLFFIAYSLSVKLLILIASSFWCTILMASASQTTFSQKFLKLKAACQMLALRACTCQLLSYVWRGLPAAASAKLHYPGKVSLISGLLKFETRLHSSAMLFVAIFDVRFSLNF